MPSNRLLGRVIFVVVVGLSLALLLLSVGPTSTVAAANGNVSLYRADGVSFENSAAIEAAVANGTIETADQLVVGERPVVAIDSERLAATIDRANGTPTAGFLAAI